MGLLDTDSPLWDSIGPKRHLFLFPAGFNDAYTKWGCDTRNSLDNEEEESKGLGR